MKFTNISAVFILICAINYLTSTKVLRIDLTQDRIYSLSESSVRLLQSLDDVVTVKCFFSKNLPPVYQKLDNQVRDLLSEYKNWAGENLDIEFLDPREDQRYRQLANTSGIPEIQMNVIESDQVQSVKGFLGISVFYEDKSAVIPVLSNPGNLEYEITSAIKRVFSRKLPVIKIGLFNNPENDRIIMEKFQDLFRYIGKQADTGYVNLPREDIPENTDLLLIIRPVTTDEISRYRIDQYLVKGGQLLVLSQMFEPDQSMYGELLEHRLNLIFENLKMKIDYVPVLDKGCEFASFRNGYTTFSLPYNLFIKVHPVNFSRDFPVFNRISSITLPWAPEVTLIRDDTKESESLPLFTTTEFNGISNTLNFDPEQNFMISDRPGQKKALGAVFNGRYKSIYSSNQNLSRLVSEMRVKKPDFATSELNLASSVPGCRAVIIPNSKFVQDDFLPRHEGNLVFLMNIIDWMTMGEELTGIRSKTLTDRPLFTKEPFFTIFREKKELLEKIKASIRLINIFTFPVLLIIYGLIRRSLRERKRNKHEQAFERRQS